MAATAKKDDPALWRKVRDGIRKGSKGGRPGQWSARKAQMAVQEYKAEGGGYAGPKSRDNHLASWTREDWGTASGARSRDTGERYLPRKARASLTKDEYARTTTRKRRDTASGKQFSTQPKDVARKTSRARKTSHDPRVAITKAQLYEQAKRVKIPGRSRMTRAQLQAALRKNKKTS